MLLIISHFLSKSLPSTNCTVNEDVLGLRYFFHFSHYCNNEKYNIVYTVTYVYFGIYTGNNNMSTYNRDADIVIPSTLFFTKKGI